MSINCILLEMSAERWLLFRDLDMVRAAVIMEADIPFCSAVHRMIALQLVAEDHVDFFQLAVTKDSRQPVAALLAADQ